jgi:Xaa-Pro aminopeptidase
MPEVRLQSFDESGGRAQSASRIAALRAELKRRGLDGFVVPRADRQQNEYLPASEERFAWLTGFTGSAGAAIVLADKAVLFVDGRYTVQAQAQADPEVFSIAHLVEKPPEQWLEQNLKSGTKNGTKLGYDPWLHTTENAEKLRAACASAGATLVALDSNPIDALWTDRPAPPSGPVLLRPIKLSGERAADKLKRIRAEIARLRADVLVVSDPQNVAWAFNIRGSDVAHTPLALAFAMVPREGRPALYVEAGKLDKKTRLALEEFADMRAPDDLLRDLGQMKDKTVRLDQASAADALSRLVTDNGGRPVAAHRRDGWRWRASWPGSTAKRHPAR